MIVAAAGCAEPSPRADSPAAVSPMYVGVSVEPWNFGKHRGQRVRTADYDVYSTVNDPAYNARLAVTLQSARREYERLTGLPSSAATRPGGEAEHLMHCYVFADRFQFVEFTKIRYPGRDDLLTFNRGGYTVGDVFASHWAGDGTIATAAHEGFHQYLARSLRESLPPFLEEGLASTFEIITWSGRGEPRWDFARHPAHARSLAKAVEHDVLIPLVLLARLDAGTVMENPRVTPYPLYYAQCWAFARFMIDGEGGAHRPALKRMIDEAAAGRLYDPTGANTRPAGTFRPSEAAAAVERALGRPLADVEPAYRAYVRQIAATVRDVE